MNIIKFYRKSDEYGFFSNFSAHKIWVEQMFWPTVEHYYQASKYTDEKIRKKIREFDSPMDAATEGRKISHKIRDDWDIVRTDFMYKGLRAKFFQHYELKKRILLTGDALLIEDSPHDSYWGIGRNNTGQNMLGITLVKIREEIKKISQDIDLVFPPWVAFEGSSELDLMWRMGIGERYIEEWVRYYETLENKDLYKKMFPEDREWPHFYDE